MNNCLMNFFLLIFLYITIEFYVCEIAYTDYSKPREGNFVVQFNLSILLGVLYNLITLFYIILLKNSNTKINEIQYKIFCFLVIFWFFTTIYSIIKIGSEVYDDDYEKYMYSKGFAIIFGVNNLYFIVFMTSIGGAILNYIKDACCKKQTNNYYRA